MSKEKIIIPKYAVNPELGMAEVDWPFSELGLAIDNCLKNNGLELNGKEVSPIGSDLFLVRSYYPSLDSVNNVFYHRTLDGPEHYKNKHTGSDFVSNEITWFHDQPYYPLDLLLDKYKDDKLGSHFVHITLKGVMEAHLSNCNEDNSIYLDDSWFDTQDFCDRFASFVGERPGKFNQEDAINYNFGVMDNERFIEIINHLLAY